MKKLYRLWIAIFIIMIAWGAYSQYQSQLLYLPLPDKLTKIRIDKQNSTFTFHQKNGQWFFENKQNPKIESLIGLLHQPCLARYQKDEIEGDMFAASAISLLINQQPFIIGDFNPINQSGYIKSNGVVWLCSNQIRARLLQDHHYWRP